MKLNLKLKSDNGVLNIIDKTNYKSKNNNLLNYDGTFRYVDCISVDVLVYHTPEGDIVKSPIFRSHSFDDVQQTAIEILEDGHFTLYHFELLSKEFAQDAKNLDKVRLIYTDGEKFYEKYLGFVDVITLDDLLSNLDSGAMISYQSFEQVSIWNFTNQYISLLTEDITNSAFKKTKLFSDTLYNLKIYIDTIEYLCNHHMEHEASRLFYKMQNCNNLNTNKNNGKSRCGCKI